MIEAAWSWRWEEHAVGAIIPKLVNVLYRSSCWRRMRLRMGAIGARKEAALDFVEGDMKRKEKDFCFLKKLFLNFFQMIIYCVPFRIRKHLLHICACAKFKCSNPQPTLTITFMFIGL